MTLQPITVQRFSGLDLASDPPEVWGGGASRASFARRYYTEAAVDILNVDLNLLGRLRTRDGMVQEVALSAGTPSMVHAVGSVLYIARGTQVDKVSGGGVANLGTAANITSIAQLGTPTSSLVFFGSSSTGLKKYDGATFGNSTCASTALYVTVSPWDNRLIQASVGATPTGSSATAGTSTVVFSDAGAPETYSANNYDYLHPGDGESITGMVTWRDMVFITKSTRMFIYSGVTASGTGQPIFNYRTVDLPSQVRGSFNVVTAGADGVYLACKDGIYLTVGGVPQKISQRVNPIFDGSAGNDLRVAAANGLANVSAGPFSLGWALGRLYMAYPTQSGLQQWLVWDSHLDEWMIYRIGDGSVAYPVPATVGGELYTVRDGSTLRFTSTATDDAGTAISSYYQAGWSDFGQPERKRIREIAVWGSGTLTFSMFADRASSDPSAAAMTLGTAPVVSRTAQTVARTARQLSWKVQASSGAFNVSSVELYWADQRASP